MARYPFEEQDPPTTLDTPGSNIILWIVRGFGFLLMLIGFFVAVRVIFEVWGLYIDPAGIESFASAIETSSGLDAALKTGMEEDGAAGGGVRLSYFIAWFIGLVLLMIVGRLAIAAMHVGGQLVLWDVPLSRLVKVMRRANRN